MQQVAKSFFLRNNLTDSQVKYLYVFNSNNNIFIDVYISMVSSAHAVCAKGLYIAMISTTVETTNPELEIKPALELLGDVLEMFVNVSSIYAPTSDGTNDNVRYSIYFNKHCYLVVHNKKL